MIEKGLCILVTQTYMSWTNLAIFVNIKLRIIGENECMTETVLY